MRIGVPKEIKPQENRIGLTPNSVRTLVSEGHEVLVENNGGFEAGFENDQYIKAGAKIVKKASDTEKIVKSLKDNAGIYLVPAFTGIGAPYWNANARGVLSGITRDTSPEEIIRATIEAVAYQTYDLFEAMKHDGLRPKIVKVDGGMVMNNWFSQFLSDIINVKVLRPEVQETTAAGAAFMAGLKIGVYKSLKDISKNWNLNRKFSPKMSNVNRSKLIKGWSKAIDRTLIN